MIHITPPIILRLNALIAFGRATDGDVQNLLAAFDGQSGTKRLLSRRGDAFWQSLAGDLSREDHYCLLKGLVRSEPYCLSLERMELNSSVSPAITVLRCYVERVSISDAESVLRWCARETANDVLLNMCAWQVNLFIDEYSKSEDGLALSWSALMCKLKDRVKDRERAAKELRDKEKKERRAAAHAKRLSHYDDRSQKIMSELDQAASLPPMARLQWLSETKIPLDAVSNKLLDDCYAIAEKVPSMSREQLLQRLYGRKQAHWRRLVSALNR